jgi:hypothetical protein
VPGKNNLAFYSSMYTQEISKYEALFKDIIAKGKLEQPVPVSEETGKPKKNSAHRLLARLEKYDIETLSFMYDFNIPLIITLRSGTYGW